MKVSTFLAVGMALALSACSTVSVASKDLKPKVTGKCGGASWYALHGRRTAEGSRMNMHAMTAAHKSMKFGTKIRVTNQRNGKSVVVRINDRGPFVRGRILDLSKGAAGKIGMVGAGHAQVCYQKL